jgi:hypothetical protein
MLRHSLIAGRAGDPGAPAPVSLAGESWRDHVPVRLPDTITVKERLPTGAAAVLINRGHSFTDLVLPIDAAEERLVGAIDGRRSIGEIARGEGQLERARPFFERLHDYDQIVFDASATGSAARISGSEPRVPFR